MNKSVIESAADLLRAVQRRPGQTILQGPRRVSSRRGRHTVASTLWVKAPLRKVAPAFDPRTWPSRCPLFAETRKLDAPVYPGPVGTTSWSGKLLERFAIDWASIRWNEFTVVLNIDLAISQDAIRLDYSLDHEKRGRLIVDEGYATAELVSACPGWVRIDAVKTVQFKSRLLNAQAPMWLALFMRCDPEPFLRPAAPQKLPLRAYRAMRMTA